MSLLTHSVGRVMALVYYIATANTWQGATFCLIAGIFGRSFIVKLSEKKTYTHGGG